MHFEWPYSPIGGASWLWVLTWVLLPGRAQAQSSEPKGTVSVQECCLPLLFPFGARAVSLGQALTARASADGLFVNPAAMSGDRKDQFIVHNADTFEGQTNVFSLLIDGGVAGTFGLTYVLVDQGEEEATDDFGNVTGTLALRHHQLLASFATHVTAGVRAGISYKLYNFGYGCSGDCRGLQTSGTTHLVDLGVQMETRWVPTLELGLSVLHFGLPLQLVNAEQADPTPTRVRLGASYQVGRLARVDSTIAIWIAGDVVDRLRDPGHPVLAGGVEVGFDNTIFVRAGYSGSGDGIAKGGTGIGIGIHYQRFTIGVAKSFTRSELETEGEPFQVSFGIAF